MIWLLLWIDFFQQKKNSGCSNLEFVYFFLCYSPYVDGGIMSNNPTMDLLTEIAEYNIAQRAVDKDTEVVEPTVCLSLGTGVPPVKKVSQSLSIMG